MKAVYVFLSAIAVASAAPSPRNYVGFLGTEAIEAYNNHVRIIGGYEVIRSEKPWQVGLLISIIGMDGTGLCGASLVSQTRAVTAAHCWSDGINQGEMMQAVFGAHRINEFEEGSVRLNTNDVVTHPDWFPALIRNDIAIVKFPAVQFSEFIQPINLPAGDQLFKDFTGDIGYASGWGITSNNGPAASPVLLATSMRIISNDVCSRTSLVLVTENNICTSGIGGGAVCNGDSGGPLVVYLEDGTPILVGVTSFRHLLGCESIMPSMFVRVTSYIEWIRSEL